MRKHYVSALAGPPMIAALLFIPILIEAEAAAFPGVHRAAGSVPPGLLEKKIARTYQWDDLNSAKILGRKEDRIFIDGSVPVRRFRIELSISPIKLETAMNSFGIPVAQLTFRYRNQEEFRQKETDLIARAASRGISYSRKSKAFSADFGWIVKKSRIDMREVVLVLSEAARKAEYKNRREILGLFASFVQAIPYMEQPATRQLDDGSEIFVAGVTMPLETLVNNFGDCDTKSLLFGALLSNTAETKIIFLRGGGHVFVGVQTVPRPNDRYVRLRNDTYVLVELTSPWLIGHIPAENWRGLQGNKFEVIQGIRSSG